MDDFEGAERPEPDSELPASDLSVVRHYHQWTKHDPTRSAPGPGYMDWANQPDPFRLYLGARVFELPFDEAAKDPAFDDLDWPGRIEPAALEAGTLSLFLELALGITAWKESQGTRWALRANPSSGNLHPTECYLILPSVTGLASQPGVFHYSPREHTLEELCSIAANSWQDIAGAGGDNVFLSVLSSVHWREAWKYGERAFRYCQHDAGHAIGSMRYAAAALGWTLRMLPQFSDQALGIMTGLGRHQEPLDGEQEYADFAVVVNTAPDNEWQNQISDSTFEFLKRSDWHGQPNQLSASHVIWPAIEAVARQSSKPPTGPFDSKSMAARESGPEAGDRAPPGEARALSVIRGRRSAVAMDARTSISYGSFRRMLRRTLPFDSTVPWDCFPYRPSLSLAIFVHRVESLLPGLYVLIRSDPHLESLRSVCRGDFSWAQRSDDDLPLYLLDEGDFRQIAEGVSCQQAIAGDSAFSLGMIADFSSTLKAEGAWSYRRLFWEAGLIGQVLYLEAGAADIQATGIGCYFDDLMHEIMGMDTADDAWQSLYHFTVGGAVHDQRLVTLPAYYHLPKGRFDGSSA